MAHDNEFYCGNFYKGLYITKTNLTDVSVSSCCVNKPSEPSSEIVFDRHPYLLAQRQQSTSGPVDGCDTCIRDESAGGQSYRQQVNRWYKENFPDQDPYETAIVKLDYNVDPVCNAKCIMCNSHFSSAWAEEDREHGENRNFRKFLDIHQNKPYKQLDFSKLRRVYFNGGEPLLSAELTEILGKIKKEQGSLSHIHFQTSTNGSISPSQRLVELLNECGQVDIFPSLDGIQEVFEYVRYPLRWEKVWQNLCEISKRVSISKITLSFTVGVHNIDHVQRAVSWIEHHQNEINYAGYGFNRCLGELQLDTASKDLVAFWRQKYAFDAEAPQWHRGLHQMISDVIGQESNDTWLDHLATIDKRRRLDWRENLPELHAAVKYLSI